MLLNCMKRSKRLLVKYENECCGCAVPAYPCMGSACPNRRVPHLYCDKCGEEVDKLYEYDSQQLCIDCIEASLKEVEV